MELNWKILPTVFDETGCLRWSSLATCFYSLHFIDDKNPVNLCIIEDKIMPKFCVYVKYEHKNKLLLNKNFNWDNYVIRNYTCYEKNLVTTV